MQKRQKNGSEKDHKVVDGGILLPSHKSSFCSELRYEDLQRLRSVMREFFNKRTRTRTRKHEISDVELDKWIEAKGPVVREKMIKYAVDNKLTG